MRLGVEIAQKTKNSPLPLPIEISPGLESNYRAENLGGFIAARLGRRSRFGFVSNRVGRAVRRKILLLHQRVQDVSACEPADRRPRVLRASPCWKMPAGTRRLRRRFSNGPGAVLRPGFARRLHRFLYLPDQQHRGVSAHGRHREKPKASRSPSQTDPRLSGSLFQVSFTKRCGRSLSWPSL